ncbi:hypothetical protein ACOMHN_062397 [Nucella lapillus]
MQLIYAKKAIDKKQLKGRPLTGFHHTSNINAGQLESKSESLTRRDGHQSKFSLQRVADNFYTAGPQTEGFLWDGPRINKEHLPVTTFDHPMETEDGAETHTEQHH